MSPLPPRLPPLRRGRPLARRRPCPQPHLRGRHRRAPRPAQRTVSDIPFMAWKRSCRPPPKLPRREGVWVLVDLDSTNGTFVDGERVKGEAPLAPGATVRFGDVQLVFEPTDDALGVAKGGGTQVLRTPHSIAPNVSPSPAPR